MEALFAIVMQFFSQLLSSGGEVAGTLGQGAGEMLKKMDTPALLALAAALGWASGVRLYLVVFLVGIAGAVGALPLPDGLKLLQNPAMLAASGGMVFVEFFADKIPGLDSIWDVIHTVIRVPAGAALAAGVFGADSTTMGAVAALMGGTLAATSHATKATTRAAVNTSPEPFSNIFVSLLEDGLVIFMLWLSTEHPLIFAIVLAIVLVLSILLIVVLYKFLRLIFSRIKGFLGSSQPQPT
jgi:hypothetical protein